MINLNASDYRDILYYYNIEFQRLSDAQIKKKAEKIIGDKLCSCIKKVNKDIKKSQKNTVVGICNKSVVKKKGLKINGISCKKKIKLNPYKKTKKYLKKINKSLKLRKYK